MQKLLALDTSMQACSVALAEGGGETASAVLACRHELIGRGHAERLFPMIDEVLDEAGLAIADLSALAVSRGPGSFSGVRIGLAAARGLALASGKPLVGLGTLDILAAGLLADHPAELHPPRADGMIIAIDARRDSLYWQEFTPAGKTKGPAVMLSVAKARQNLAESRKRLVVAGSGCNILRETGLPEHAPVTFLDGDLQPDARHLAVLALQHLKSRGQDAARPGHLVAPLYLRPADAKAQTGKSIPRQ